MKTLSVAVAAVALLATAASAQSLEAKYQKKLEKDFAKKVKWVQSFDSAKEIAARQGKLIFAYFSRSYAP